MAATQRNVLVSVRTKMLSPLLLALLATGCSAYKPAVLPAAEVVRPGADTQPEVKRGSSVRIGLTSGQLLSGKVARVEEDALFLEKIGNYGYEEQKVLYSEVDSIEVGIATQRGNAIIISLVVATSVTVALWYAVGNGLSGLN